MKKVCIFILILFMILLTGCNENSQKQKFFEVFNNDLIPVINKEGVYQYVNYKEQNPFNETYEYATEFLNNSAIVRKNKKEYLIDKQGEAITSEYDFIEEIPAVCNGELPDYSFGLYRAKIEDKYHFLNEYGNILLNLEFDYVCAESRSNMVYGKIGDEYIVLTKEGEEVFRISNVYSLRLGDFNTIIVGKSKNNFDLYDDKGNLLFKDSDNIYIYNKDIISIRKNDVEYYINKQGEIILSQYDDIVLTNDTIVGKENGLWYLINIDGDKIINEGFELHNYLSDVIEFKRDGKFYVLNQGGYLEKSEQGFDDVIMQSNFVVCYEIKEESKNIFIYDLNGKLIFECEGINNYGYRGYIRDKEVKELYLVFNVDGERKLYNIVKKTIHETYDDELMEIVNGLIIYRKYVDEKRQHFVTNMENKIILSYSETYPTIRNNQVLYSIDGKVGVVNKDGENILSCVYNMVPSIYYYPVY